MTIRSRYSLIYKILIPVLVLILCLISFFYFYISISLEKSPNLKILLLLFLFVVLFFIVYFIYLRKIINKPIDRLISAMWNVSRGRYGKTIDEYSSREFNLLYHSFNSMVFELNYLKVDYYEEKLKLQEAELNYFQSQIKPHFFLNSLNIIYNLSTLKEFENIEKMSLYLGNYFQFTINNEKRLVTLSEEITHIKNYLDIQCMRIADQITYNIVVEDNIKQALIPPLTIQPFVENSIIHGMKEMNDNLDKFNIDIIGSKKNGEFIEIEIIDNGQGFSIEKLRCFQQKKFGKGGEHIGIWNVYKRLNLNFKKKADIKFYNLDDGGAVVRLIIPYTE